MPPLPPDDPKLDQEKILTAEMRAQITREFRRGMTQKAIAGGLKISPQVVAKILAEDLHRVIEQPTKMSYDLIDVELDVEDQDLKYRLREEKAAKYGAILKDKLPKEQEEEPESSTVDHLESFPYTPEAAPPGTNIIPYIQSYDRSIQDIVKKQEVFRLRKQGKDYQTIQKLTGVSPQDARKIVQWELSTLDQDELKDRDLARRMQLERLDALFEACWQAATRQPTEEFPLQGPDMEAARMALRILERQSKLLGLDSPAKVDIEERVRYIARRNGLDEEEMVRYAVEAIKVRVLPG